MDTPAENRKAFEELGNDREASPFLVELGNDATSDSDTTKVADWTAPNACLKAGHTSESMVYHKDPKTVPRQYRGQFILNNEPWGTGLPRPAPKASAKLDVHERVTGGAKSDGVLQKSEIRLSQTVLVPLPRHSVAPQGFVNGSSEANMNGHEVDDTIALVTHPVSVDPATLSQYWRT